jgi:ABC-type multidrug transport system fused ATPase/permease subunit
MSAPTQIPTSLDQHKHDVSPETDQPPSPHGWVRFVAHYLRPHRGRFLLLTALLFSNVGLTLVGPQVIRAFIDATTANAPQSTLIALAALALGAAIVNELAAAAATYVGQDVGWAATNLLREDLALHLLRLDMSFHNAHTPGEFIERIDGDLTNLSNFFALLILKVIGSLGLLVGTLVLLYFADWRVGLALALFVVVAFAVIVRMRSVAVGAGIEEREVSATFLGFLEERLAGVEDIRANGGGEYTMYRFTLAMRRWFAQSVHAWTRRSSIWTVTTLLFALGMALTLGLSAYLYLVTHTISLGTVYLFFQYMVLMQAPIEQITQQMQEFQKAMSSLIRVRRLLALRARIPDGAPTPSAGAGDAGTLAKRGSRGPRRKPMGDTQMPSPVAVPAQHAAHAPATAVGVRFEHVTFAYGPGEESVLRDVDFALAPGQVLGLLGRTGSGKTTISRLLCRLYDVGAGTGQGAVRLDGTDVREMSLAALRRRVGVVTQDVQLFQASVRDNLTFFDPRIADARILAVIRQMELDSWLARLPKGLNTPLEAGGGGLSAGEAQLLAFVRVFLRNPGLVILDEPSSRLDPATERLIERGVDALLRGRTAVIIAHRLATVQRADVILTLGDGRVLEVGPREALARNPQSHFAALLRAGRAIGSGNEIENGTEAENELV